MKRKTPVHPDMKKAERDLQKLLSAIFGSLEFRCNLKIQMQEN